MDLPEDIEKQIASAMRADQFSLRRFLRSIRNAQERGKPFDRNLQKLLTQTQQSTQKLQLRADSVPKITWPEELPVVGRRDEIAEAIRQHQVIVVCGETGSGKSTQLPKIALELGRGIGGVIGHTQPRRIAARSIATRVAEELKCDVGQQVGYRIRFNDASGDKTLVRLMTDGIMLAETQSDRFLDQYDTIIVDEAHERSLNIDFLLGYLKRLLPKRKDLRLIITSATIDAERFADHFAGPTGPAPVLLVEGRTYPVEVRYRPLDDDDAATDPDDQRRNERDWLDGVADAVQEVAQIDNGHILVFLPTERDIREADKRLSGLRLPGDSPKLSTQVVPLFGRLSMADQTKVFQPYQGRRIVLATNVAESSLTVPGIRYVIDTGTARISRYSARSRIQRLPVEPVSQASARQRAGRCGRVGPGVCIRLYSEADFNGRDAFTTPEIQRTNLAAVILRTMNLKLGRLDEFPFLDPPRPTTVREGYATLLELGAISVPTSAARSSSHQAADGTDYVLTERGRQMARLPVDPRISRMILAAIDEQAVPEVMVIAAALETQDPRERPLEKQQAADEAHRQFQHEDSDFLTLLNLWDAWHDRKEKLSGSQLRKWCRQNFLSWMRMREWIDVHRQLRDLLKEAGDPSLEKAAGLHHRKDRRNDYAAIHRSLMTGLLANIAFKSAEREYQGAGGTKLIVWPGSSLSKKPPRWFMAAELVETSQRFGRTIARIQPEWVESVADHLLKREHTEPHWDSKAGNVMCFEKVSLWGLPIVPRRKTSFARVNPEKSREMLIEFGLVSLALLYGQTDDERESEYADEENELRFGQRSRIVPGQAVRADPSSAAFQTKTPGRDKGWGRDFPFLKHNVGVLEEIKAAQARTRRHDLLPTEDVLYEYYNSRIPPDVCDRNRLKQWYRKASKANPMLLHFDVNTFTSEEQRNEGSDEFPTSIALGPLTLPLTYQLEPGRESDGVTVSVPVEALSQLDQNRLTWLVPGLVGDKVTALIRSLPADLRRQFVPAPDTARQVVETLSFGQGNMLSSVADALTKLAGQAVHPESFNLDALPDFLRFNIRIVDGAGKRVAENRDISRLRESLRDMVSSDQSSAVEEQQWRRSGFTAWDFAEIPTQISITRAGLKILAYPAVRDDITAVSLTLCQTVNEAHAVLSKGLRRLILLQERDRVQRQVKHLPNLQQIQKLARGVKSFDVTAQLALLLVERAWMSAQPLPRNKAEFDAFVVEGRRRVSGAVHEINQVVPGILQGYHDAMRVVDSSSGPGREIILNRLRQQLQELVYAECLGDTPWPWLLQLPRYTQGIRARIDRLSTRGLQKELETLQDFQRYEQRFFERRSQQRQQNLVDPMLDHYRWMLEEFRISVFAPKIGTAIQVSGPKLDEQWEKVL